MKLTPRAGGERRSAAAPLLRAGENRGGSGLLQERGWHGRALPLPLPFAPWPLSPLPRRTGTALAPVPAFRRGCVGHRAHFSPPALVSPAAAVTAARGKGLALLAAGFRCRVPTFAEDDDGGR